jgi:hypothetical protein
MSQAQRPALPERQQHPKLYTSLLTSLSSAPSCVPSAGPSVSVVPSSKPSSHSQALAVPQALYQRIDFTAPKVSGYFCTVRSAPSSAPSAIPSVRRAPPAPVSDQVQAAPAWKPSHLPVLVVSCPPALPELP